MQLSIAVIPGDGIGPEVISHTTAILNRICELYGHKFQYKHLLAGGCAIDAYGTALPEQTLRICKQSDSILMGPVGGWKWDNLPGDCRPETALTGLREQLELFANLRPISLYDSFINSCVLRPEILRNGFEMLIVRELTGGIYFGESGRRQTEDGEAAFDTMIYSEKEIRRIATVAFRLARLRKRHLTSIDMANALESSRLWRLTVSSIAKDYPDITIDHLYFDTAVTQLLLDPGFFDVIVTANMFGGIFSEQAAQITGSIELFPSACMGESGTFGLYHPIHGAAPELAGADIANPIATILSAAMMLRYSFALVEEAEAIENAVISTLDAGFRTSDIMSHGMTPVNSFGLCRQIISRII